MKRPHYLKAKACGFTLIELLVVIAVLGAVIALVFPKIFRTTSALKSDASKTAALFTYLGESSSSKRVYYKAALDINDGLIRLEESGNGKDFVEAGDPRLRMLKLSDGVSIEDITVAEGKINKGTVSIVFPPSGGVPFVIHLKSDSTDEKVSISYNPFAARAYIEEGYV